MDMLSKQWGKMKLTEVEKSDFVIESDDGNQAVDNSKKIAGRMLSSKHPNLKAIANALNIVWKTNRGFKINDGGDGIFVIEFQSTKDKAKVLEDSPWHYDRNLLILADLEGVSQFSQINFNLCDFWMRLIDVSWHWRTSGLIRRLVGRFGEVLETDEFTLDMTSKYVRVRARIDITKLLVRGVKVRSGKDEVTWIAIKYERLPNFCYNCGILGHTHDDCEVEKEADGDVWPYEPTLRATPTRVQIYNCGYQERKYNQSIHSTEELSRIRRTNPARKLFDEGPVIQTTLSAAIGRDVVAREEALLAGKLNEEQGRVSRPFNLSELEVLSVFGSTDEVMQDEIEGAAESVRLEEAVGVEDVSNGKVGEAATGEFEGGLGNLIFNMGASETQGAGAAKNKKSKEGSVAVVFLVGTAL